MSNSSSQPIAGFDFPGQLPEIQVNDRQLRDLIEETWQAILAANKDPYLFQRNGKLVFIESAGDGFRIREMNKTLMDAYLTQVAKWHSTGKTKKTEIFPPMRLARLLIDFPKQEIPYLEEVTTIPSFDRNGKLMNKFQYYPQEQLWLGLHPDFQEMEISEKPSVDEVWASREFLQKSFFGHFSFKADSDNAQAMALIIQPFMRKMIRGPVPLYLLSSENGDNRVLAEALGLLLSGRKPFECRLSPNDDKVRAAFLKALHDCHPIVVFDGSQSRFINSPSFASLIRAERWRARIPGTNTSASYENRTLWVLLADQTSFSEDFRRLCVPIRMVQPENSDRKLAETYLQLISENREQIVKAILTLIQHWIAVGKPLRSFTKELLG